MASPHALAAAEWWANLLRKPPNMDNGDAFQSAFASVAAAKVFKERSEEVIARFRDLLAQTIDDRLAKGGSRYFGVDYHPCIEIHEAAVESGLPGYSDMLTFPFKTGMWVTPDKIELRAGYGAPIDVIWRAP